MRTHASSLLLEIARCPNVAACARPAAKRHPCAAIVSSQTRHGAHAFQIPEPWNGRLDEAQILFIGLNPGVNPREQYPVDGWEAAEVVDFFVNRFGGGRKPWILDGTRPLESNGAHVRRQVRFLAEIRSRAAELLNIVRANVRPGHDYALTEVVHCKSKESEGVADAAAECASRWLARILQESVASVVVCLGKEASGALGSLARVTPAIPSVTRVELGGRMRALAFMPHTNARRTRTFTTCLSAADLAALRAALT